MSISRKPYKTFTKEFKLEALRLMSGSNKPAAGQSVYVDNIYFLGESTTFDLTISVTDDAIPGANVSVGNVTATTNGSGVAILTLHEAAHKVFVDADGFGIGQGNQTIAGGDASLAMSVIPINAVPSAPSPTASNDDAFVLYSDALTRHR